MGDRERLNRLEAIMQKKKTENKNIVRRRRRTDGRAKQDGGGSRAGEKDGRALDASISVIRYHPLFAHQTQHLCVVLVFMSELITGRQLPDQ